MHVVIVAPRPLKSEIYGPFKTSLHAADWADAHRSNTGEYCSIHQVQEPKVYGDEGL